MTNGDSSTRGGSSDPNGGGGTGGSVDAHAGRVPEDVLARLVEEIDDTNEILADVRRRGVADDIARRVGPTTRTYTSQPGHRSPSGRPGPSAETGGERSAPPGAV